MGFVRRTTYNKNMRGTETILAGVPQAAAVLDLALSGVTAEMAETPFTWKAAAQVPQPSSVASVEVAVRPASPPPLLATAKKAGSEVVVVAKPQRLVEDTPGEVWREGDVAADVVLVVQGAMPDARCQALALAMLAAVGLKGASLGWVGYEGAVKADALRNAIGNGPERHVLVMGQGPLGVLLGRNLGVEGWHAASGADSLEIEGAVGVTYPLDLLLKQSLFKRLAWQHLLAWGCKTQKQV